ncbi:MAG: GMC family oxidoreductase [Flavobacteriales bacterium]|nr:GMC family oxidoreductase [Flavobacteriales bacterium]MBK6945633.1 GMC family oxidoreductase [Flavobacteriales bacterium]MBK7296260.1 GMC family oxidoreductase [Flavobacteriales bacterium]MBK9534815.1 GMC family oxidoreductase [Flavobacteriales bacterium]MBP9137713.1 GMC family oxidoreductase [Flavobacteriales bacterium]
MKVDYDYVIIGSGFGGSVSALRLSQKGYKVLVVEKGKWYTAKDFPKTNWNFRKWLWLPRIRFFGIMKLTIFRHIAVLSGTGVGGGSLVYANTLPIPKTTFFKTGSWSTLHDWEKELAPYYKLALKMLGAAKTPKLFDGDIALKNVAKKLGLDDKFDATNVAVYFGEENVTVADPYFDGQGPERTGCNYCGACMTGCRNNSKNTLDKNYLHLAQQHGVEILAENEVYDVRPIKDAAGTNGYGIALKTSTKLITKRKKITSKGVIFSGGVLGTVKLLLKLKKTSLPNISDRLGQDIRTNNETLVSVSSLEKDTNYSKGVAIGSILDTDENSHLEVVRYAEGSNAWKLVHIPYATGNNGFTRLFKVLVALVRSPIRYLKIYFVNRWAKKTVVLLFMQTLDSTLRFKRNIFGLMSSTVSTGKKPTPFIAESVKLIKEYSKAVNGVSTSFALETIAGIPSTAHILGGAVMGEDATKGVIDKDNKIFGYADLYVIDGSMISANPGVNPALSITAIAERAMDQIRAKKELV